MKIFLKSLATLLLATLVFSCGGNTTPTGGSTTTLQPANLATRTVTSFRPDSLAGFAYFSFDRDTVVPANRANTAEWDIRLRFLRQERDAALLDLLVNSGNANPNGQTRGLLVERTFDLVDIAPEDSQLRTEDTTANRRIVVSDFSGPGLFVYNPSQRTVTINPQRTLTLRTASGKYVKVQFLNLYQNAPAMPTMFNAIGFYTFRYTKSDTRAFK